MEEVDLEAAKIGDDVGAFEESDLLGVFRGFGSEDVVFLQHIPLPVGGLVFVVGSVVKNGD